MAVYPRRLAADRVSLEPPRPCIVAECGRGAREYQSMLGNKRELEERLGALLDCAAVAEGASRWVYLDQALKLHVLIQSRRRREPAAMEEARSFRGTD